MIPTMTTEQIWIGIGVVGQACFGMRILLQWIATERKRRSVVPISFWLFSVAGGITLLSYAIYRLDPVFIIAEGLGLIIYARNLYFIRRPIHRVRR
jgi:lipid-A-disaccharide synthase-like uncharacterized protein